MPELYEEHHCLSLLRFDLSRLPCEKVQAAKVRLYKPKCTVQMTVVNGWNSIFQLSWYSGGSIIPMKGRSHFDPMTPISAAEAQGFLLTSESMRTST